MTDFRALCAELITLNYERTDNVMEWVHRWNALMDRARAALAQPEPQEPTDYELAQLFSDSNRQAIKGACSTPEQAAALIRSHMEYARAVLARYGRPAIEPVPVVEGADG